MKPRILAFSNVAAVLSLTILTFAAAAPANAQATRTWVSGVGDDANPCSRTAPCKTFAGAISKTAASGEINVLDPGGFGGVTITKAITIRSQVEAGVLVSGTNAIVIAAGAADDVTLEGLDIEGLNTGLNGIQISTGKNIYVLDCRIRHFTQNAINQVSSTLNSRVFVKNTLIYLNHAGVNIQGNGAGGVLVDTVADTNAIFAAQVSGANNNLALVRSMLVGGSTATLNLVAGGTASAFGPSNVVAGTIVGTLTPVAFQ